jgi:hypothetical protein
MLLRVKQSRTLTVSDEADDELQGCNVCGDGTSDDLNQILFCDGCNVPIHQHCYGVDLIPEGEWFCQRCELLGHRSGMLGLISSIHL